MAEGAAHKTIHRKVVNVSSIAGIIGNMGQTHYAAGEVDIVGATKSLAREWGRYAVNVNAVAFGYVVTRMTQAVEGPAPTVKIGGRAVPAGIPVDQLRAMEVTIPLGRGAAPEAAGASALLCYPESDYVTGHVLMATGRM